MNNTEVQPTTEAPHTPEDHRPHRWYNSNSHEGRFCTSCKRFEHWDDAGTGIPDPGCV